MYIIMLIIFELTLFMLNFYVVKMTFRLDFYFLKLVFHHILIYCFLLYFEFCLYFWFKLSFIYIFRTREYCVQLFATEDVDA